MASESFDKALPYLLVHEGGFSNNPKDSGGATMRGITQSTLSEWRGVKTSVQEVKTLKNEEISEIYRAKYWDAIMGNKLPIGLDYALFDFAVNSGVKRAVVTLQKILNLTPDGVVGSKTILAANSCDNLRILEKLTSARLSFLQSLSSFSVFGRGWVKRVREVEQQAKEMMQKSSYLYVSVVGEVDKISENITAISASNLPEYNVIINELEKGIKIIMEDTKSLFMSRTLWANSIGMLALIFSWFGVDTHNIDTNALTDATLQVIAGGGFIASSIFRVVAVKKIA